MEKQEIERYLKALEQELSQEGVVGEVCLYGGAVMCLVYEARPATKDVDAIFKPADQIRKAAKRVADTYRLGEDWLNDAVKDFVVSHPSKILLDLPHLKVYAPEPDYLLAMKAMSARVDTTDKDDVLALIRIMKLKTAQEVFAIIEKYYPRQRIRPASQFFIEELFGQ